MKKPTDFRAVLEVFARHEVELVLVGGFASTLLGVPVTTYVVDVAYRRSNDNIGRMLAALSEMEAIFANDVGRRRLAPTAALLDTARPKLLQTKFGRLDMLGELRPDLGFEELDRDAVPTSIGGITIKVISLNGSSK